MSDFWEGFWIGIISWYIFWWVIKQLLVSLVLHIAKDKIAELKSEEEEILLKLEQHGDLIYCYRKDNDEFVGQGKTLDEVAELFKKKYPNNNAKVLKEDFNKVF
jgi:hypothetical protein